MKTTFGTMPTTMPPGFFKAVRFPVLALLDQRTSGGDRLLESAGGGVRFMPQPIRFQPSDIGAHDGALPSGTLFEITLDPESGIMSGQGFLLNDPTGRTHARMIATQAQDRNSVDLGDVKARFEEDLQTGDYWISFYQWRMGATTGVARPAFAEAHAEVDPMSDDELMASLGEDPMDALICNAPCVLSDVKPFATEMVAAGAITAPHDAFFEPEADVPTKIVVTADGRVYGHLALWGQCHDGYANECKIAPRPSDNFASFNKNGPLTDRGVQVETGPIFAFGGHRRAGSAATIAEAYGGIENAWADVRVIQGRLGPWISGVVRPGVSEETIYAARASRISGHWLGDRLRAIVSVNAEGFDVPGSTQAERDLLAGFAFSVAEDGEMELVASLPPCTSDAPMPGSMVLHLQFENLSDLSAGAVNAAVLNALGVTTEPAAAAEGEDVSVSDAGASSAAFAAALLLDEPDL